MRITIIGAGFSGGVLATELMRHASQATELRLVGVADSFGRGVAYGESRAEHLLNVRACELGADPDDIDGFARWLNLGKRAERGYMPRLAYGEYLYSRLQDAIHASRADVRLHTQEAVAVEREGRRFRVLLADGRELDSDIVVLEDIAHLYAVDMGDALLGTVLFLVDSPLVLATGGLLCLLLQCGDALLLAHKLIMTGKPLKMFLLVLLLCQQRFLFVSKCLQTLL